MNYLDIWNIKSTIFVLFIVTVNFGYGIGFRVLCVITSVWENKERLLKGSSCSASIHRTSIVCSLCSCDVNYLNLMSFQHTMKFINDKWESYCTFNTANGSVFHSGICILREVSCYLIFFPPCLCIVCFSKSITRGMWKCLLVGVF